MKKRKLTHNAGRNRISKWGILVLFWVGMISFVPVSAQQKIRLNEGWNFLKGDLGSVWEAVRPVKPGSPESVPVWEAVSLPHSFNMTDAVDPDLNYYQGPGWYTTRIKISNPYPGGRTLLHFEGAGQKTDVYVYTTKVGSHVGGYDEFTMDITDAVAEYLKAQAGANDFDGTVPVSVRCDNSRDVQMIPSDLSDFNVYGGIYRYLNLEYVPALSIGQLLVNPEIGKSGREAAVSVLATWRNPDHINAAQIEIALFDPQGRQVATGTAAVQPAAG